MQYTIWYTLKLRFKTKKYCLKLFNFNKIKH